MHNQRSRKNARLRRTYGRSPPADPTTFQSHPSTSSFAPPAQPNVVRPTAKKGLDSAHAAPSSTHFGTAAAPQNRKTNSSSAFAFPSQHQPPQSHSASQSSFPTTESSQPGKAEQGNGGSARPAFAGSRRILRAALRGAGVAAERAKSAPPPTIHFHQDEGDDEMESEDERDWLELKRLGGVAHGSRCFKDAAEYYRQSIEALESNVHHYPLLDTPELRTDKAKLHANRAASLMMLMQISEAQRECQCSIELDATYARAYLRLGRIQVLLGDTAHAQANLDTAKQLMQGNNGEFSSSDHADLASLAKMEATIKKLTNLQGEIKWYVDCGDFKQALVHTESALGLAPSCRKLQVQKVRILLHQKYVLFVICGSHLLLPNTRVFVRGLCLAGSSIRSSSFATRSLRSSKQVMGSCPLRKAEVGITPGRSKRRPWRRSRSSASIWDCCGQPRCTTRTTLRKP